KTREHIMKRIISVFTLAVLLTLSYAQPALAQDSMLGEISIFAGNFAPRGYTFCEGQELAINQNPALFSILGDKYGGDGKTTFALPDLRKAEESLKGVRYIIAIEGTFPQRQ